MTLHISSVFTYDEDAGNYIQAVEAADGQVLEGATRKAINNFVIGCKQDGIWDAIKASCILAGARTLNGALQPLAGTAPTNYNFVASDYNRKTGLVGDGSTKYLDSNRNNNADPQDSKHIALFGEHFVAPGTFQEAIGTPYSSSGWTALVIDNRTTSGIQPWINGTSYPSGMIPLTQSGFIGASRSSSATIISRAASISYAKSVNSQSPYNVTINVFRTSPYSNARLAFYSIGESLDLAKLDARVTDLITAFGAAIP